MNFQPVKELGIVLLWFSERQIKNHYDMRALSDAEVNGSFMGKAIGMKIDVSTS